MPVFNDLRVQLLVNLKFLYGPDVEVLTFYVDKQDAFQQYLEHQAIAIRFDPITTTWTKLLHGSPVNGPQYAINSLLYASEVAIAKLLSENGNSIPFKEACAQSDYICIATPESTLPDDVTTNKAIDGDQLVEEVTSKEPSTPLTGETILISKTPTAPYVGPEQKLEESETINSKSDLRGFRKKAKKQKKTELTIMESKPKEENLKAAPPYSPVSPQDDYGWGGWGAAKQDSGESTKKETWGSFLDKIKSVNVPSSELGVSDHELIVESRDDTDICAKTSKNVIEKIPPAPASDPPSQPVEELGSGSFDSRKKDKEKNNRQIAPEPEPEPEPETEKTIDLNDRGRGKASKKASKHGNKTGQELPKAEELGPETPIPRTDRLEWGKPWLASSQPVINPFPKSQSGFDIAMPDSLKQEAPPALQSVAGKHQSVVFTIHRSNELSDKPLQVMITITGGTSIVIVDAVNSYLDSKKIMKPVHGQ
ncbi:hypothetical protein F5884DRAFT_743735 [Xylogone sp. PMI_703]|nr:hypothetical protein F5884DRAFT_743735 [Xylogone sp. PMI_703]